MVKKASRRKSRSSVRKSRKMRRKVGGHNNLGEHVYYIATAYDWHYQDDINDTQKFTSLEELSTFLQTSFDSYLRGGEPDEEAQGYRIRLTPANLAESNGAIHIEYGDLELRSAAFTQTALYDAMLNNIKHIGLKLYEH